MRYKIIDDRFLEYVKNGKIIRVDLDEMFGFVEDEPIEEEEVQHETIVDDTVVFIEEALFDD